MQYNAALAITGAIKGTSKERIYRELGFESLADRRWFRSMFTFWKIVKGISPTYLQNYLLVIQHSRNPTRKNLFSVIPSKTDYFGNSFFPYSVNKWNNLDPVIRNTLKISIFKKSLLKLRPSQAYVYNVNDYVGLKLLARLRLNLSHLYEHKFRHNFQDTVNTLCSCSLEYESTTHFLLHCPFYNNQRIALFVGIRDIYVTISNLSEDNLINTLLYGNNELYNSETNTRIFNCTICYLKSSERFEVKLF